MDTPLPTSGRILVETVEEVVVAVTRKVRNSTTPTTKTKNKNLREDASKDIFNLTSNINTFRDRLYTLEKGSSR